MDWWITLVLAALSSAGWWSAERVRAPSASATPPILRLSPRAPAPSLRAEGDNGPDFAQGQAQGQPGQGTNSPEGTPGPGGTNELFGSIRRINPDFVTVQLDPATRGEEQAALFLDDETRVIQNGVVLPASQLVPGDRVRVQFDEKHHDLHAQVITKQGSGPAPAPGPEAAPPRFEAAQQPNPPNAVPRRFRATPRPRDESKSALVEEVPPRKPSPISIRRGAAAGIVRKSVSPSKKDSQKDSGSETLARRNGAGTNRTSGRIRMEYYDDGRVKMGTASD
ncbi:MAG: hypothetical protein JO317_06345 [Verrucomicrobiae bacterium]|nr:hypothetical protein [Verrucomicrobiae bacterium]